jgi:colicin import membrane protein
MQDSFREYSTVIIVSAIAHAMLLFVMSLNLVWSPRMPDQPVQLAIQATVVENTELVRQRELEAERRQQELERERKKEEQERQVVEKQRQDDKRRKADEQRKKEEQLQLADKKKKEEAQRKRQAEEKQKKENAERKRQAEEQRKKEAQAKKENERQDAERKKKAAAAAERQAQLQEQLAEEEQRLTAVQSGLLDQWIEVIRQRVIRNWRRPPGAKAGLECEVRVSQIPGGEVVSVQMGKCNGDAAIIRSIENAVYRSSPLPPPADPSLFERTLIFTFKPEQ